MSNIVEKRFQYGAHEVILRTGEVARQATGSVEVKIGDTYVLVAVVASDSAKEGQSFFPLTVNYIEKHYAAGRIPGSFFRREGRPTEKEILTSRLIDRPIRPLFPKGFLNEVQVTAQVMSLDPSMGAEVAAMLGTSAALALSGVPFNGPIGAVKIGYVDSQLVLNPSHEQLKESKLELSVAGTANAVLMVESQADELSEQVMLDAVTYGHEQMQIAINAINELVAEAGKEKWNWQLDESDASLVEKVKQAAESELSKAYDISDKQQRQIAVRAVKEQMVAEIASDENAEEVSGLLNKLEKSIVRGRILNDEPRIDGRDLVTVRPINTRVGVLPRTHGSSLFTRGETQSIVTVTMGTERDSQRIDDIEGEYKSNCLFHYNFPSYSVGECGRSGVTSRREIGHGMLAKRGIMAVLPNSEDFPYVLRMVSEITESNGSSSMASVCGSSMALMDAGVPIKAPVSGIAMGLIKEGDNYRVLSDILGDEDHLGDMDFKVAGTANGVTALQMDIKIEGITREIMEKALSQANDGRIHILNEMAKTISTKRDDYSQYAPRLTTIQVPVDKIGDVIGKGGSVIRNIQEETGTEVSINDEGLVTIAASDGEAAEKAKKWVEQLVEEVEVNRVYEGTVIKIVDFGAFVSVLPSKEGLVHISEIANDRVHDVKEYLKEGDTVKVKVLSVDKQGRVRLSMKALLS